MKNMFESQPSRVALRYEKRANEGASLKNKKASEAAKNSEVDKAKAAELLFQTIHRVYSKSREYPGTLVIFLVECHRPLGTYGILCKLLYHTVINLVQTV